MCTHYLFRKVHEKKHVVQQIHIRCHLLNKYKPSFHFVGHKPGLQIRVRIGKLFSLFLIQNICFGYSKEPSQ